PNRSDVFSQRVPRLERPLISREPRQWVHTVPVVERPVIDGHIHSRLRDEQPKIRIKETVFFFSLASLSDTRLHELSSRQLLAEKRDDIGLHRTRPPHRHRLLCVVPAKVTDGRVANLVHHRSPTSRTRLPVAGAESLRQGHAVLSRVAAVT